MRPIAVLFAACGLLIAPAAWAQGPDAGAEADAILQRAAAADLFDNVSADAVPRVRHHGSGMTCTFSAGSALNEIRLYPSGPRGDDVSCGTEEMGFVITTYASRNTGDWTLQGEMDGAVAAIRTRFPDARPYEEAGIQMDMSPPEGSGQAPLPERVTARLVVSVDGRPSLTRVSIALVDGWIIKQRATGPLDQAMSGELVAELFMTTVLLGMRNPELAAEPGAPVAPDPEKPAADI